MAQVFSVNFAKFLRSLFYGTLPVATSVSSLYFSPHSILLFSVFSISGRWILIFECNGEDTRRRWEVSSQIYFKSLQWHLLLSLVLNLNRFACCCNVVIADIEKIFAYWVNKKPLSYLGYLIKCFFLSDTKTTVNLINSMIGIMAIP